MRRTRTLNYTDAHGDADTRYILSLYLDENRKLLHAIDLNELTPDEGLKLLQSVKKHDDLSPEEFYKRVIKARIAYIRGYRTFRTERIG